MLYCQKCGHENRYGTFSCDNCSWLLDDESETVYIPEEDRQEIVAAYHADYPYHQKIHLTPKTLQLSIESMLEPIILSPDDKPYLVGRTLGTKSFHCINLNPYDADQKGVSRRHAILYRIESGWIVEDLGSTNGTRINDTRLHSHRGYTLREGDLLQFGLLTAQITIGKPVKTSEFKT